MGNPISTAPKIPRVQESRQVVDDSGQDAARVTPRPVDSRREKGAQMKRDRSPESDVSLRVKKKPSDEVDEPMQD